MRFTTYGKYVPHLPDAVNLQDLLDQLIDFLLQSGFAGGPSWHPFWGEFGDEDDRSLDGLKEAILKALVESGQLTSEMLQVLRGGFPGARVSPRGTPTTVPLPSSTVATSRIALATARRSVPGTSIFIVSPNSYSFDTASASTPVARCAVSWLPKVDLPMLPRRWRSAR